MVWMVRYEEWKDAEPMVYAYNTLKERVEKLEKVSPELCTHIVFLPYPFIKRHRTSWGENSPEVEATVFSLTEAFLLGILSSWDKKRMGWKMISKFSIMLIEMVSSKRVRSLSKGPRGILLILSGVSSIWRARLRATAFPEILDSSKLLFFRNLVAPAEQTHSVVRVGKLWKQMNYQMYAHV